MATIIQTTQDNLTFSEEDLPLGDLDLPDFQEARDPDLDTRRQTKIRQDMAVFKPHLLQRFVISQRDDGALMILDGGGRAWGMRMVHGFPKTYQVPCQVFRGLTLDQELEMWYQLNFNRTNTSALQGFLGRMHAGEQPEAKISEITQSFGLKIGKGKGADLVRCPLTMLKAYEAGVLETVYTISVTAYGTMGGGALANILGPLTNLLIRNQDKIIVNDRMVRALRDFGSPANLVANAAKNMAHHTVASIDRLMCERYNHAAKGEAVIRTHRLTPPQESRRKVTSS